MLRAGESRVPQASAQALSLRTLSSFAVCPSLGIPVAVCCHVPLSLYPSRGIYHNFWKLLCNCLLFLMHHKLCQIQNHISLASPYQENWIDNLGKFQWINIRKNSCLICEVSRVYRAEPPGRPWDLQFHVGSCVLKPPFSRTLQPRLVVDCWLCHNDLLFLNSALLPGDCKSFLLRLPDNRLFLDCGTQASLHPPQVVPFGGLHLFAFTLQYLWTTHGQSKEKVQSFEFCPQK